MTDVFGGFGEGIGEHPEDGSGHGHADPPEPSDLPRTTRGPRRITFGNDDGDWAGDTDSDECVLRNNPVLPTANPTATQTMNPTANPTMNPTANPTANPHQGSECDPDGEPHRVANGLPTTNSTMLSVLAPPPP